jgi:hypothetical protein
VCGDNSNSNGREGTYMMIPEFCGQHYSYFYEIETSHYLLLDKNSKCEVYLQGDDARIFCQEVERIDNLPGPKYNTGLLTEQAIDNYF